MSADAALAATLDEVDRVAEEYRAVQQVQRATIREPEARTIDPDTGEILTESASVEEPAEGTESADSVGAPTVTPDDETPGLLPESFWDRPSLAHVRQAARARRVAPTAVLGTLLARLAAYTRPAYTVPPFVGGTVPLSMFVALIGTTGGGKTAPARVVRELLPGVPGGVAHAVLGSGEGVTQSYLESVDITGDDGKKVRGVNRQVRYGMSFDLDEGRALAEVGQRKGSTLIPTLCSAWAGAELGAANASAETHRHLPAGGYTVGLVAGFQPTRAAGLFDDTDGGLPGRFIFLPTADPDAPDTPPPWPGLLDWQPLPAIGIGGTVTAHPMTFPPEVHVEVDERRVASLRGKHVVEPLDAHRDLLRLKVAGLLAILDGRREVTLDDWGRAEQLVDLSDRVRRSILATVAMEERQRETASHQRAARREVTVAVTLEQRSLVNMARAMAKRARKVGGTVTPAELKRSTKSSWRTHATFDDAIDYAVDHGWIRRDGDGFTVGESSPA